MLLYYRFVYPDDNGNAFDGEATVLFNPCNDVNPSSHEECQGEMGEVTLSHPVSHLYRSQFSYSCLTGVVIFAVFCTDQLNTSNVHRIWDQIKLRIRH